MSKARVGFRGAITRLVLRCLAGIAKAIWLRAAGNLRDARQDHKETHQQLARCRRVESEARLAYCRWIYRLSQHNGGTKQ